MSRPIALRVLTESGVAVEDEAVSLVVPGEIGYLGVLWNHAPLVTTLHPGRLTWRRPDGQRQHLLVGTGLFEVARNRCTVLTSQVTGPASAGSRPHA